MPINLCISGKDIMQYIAEIKGIKYLKNIKEYGIDVYLKDTKGKELPKAPGENLTEDRAISRFKIYLTATSHLGNTFIQFPEHEVIVKRKDLYKDTYRTFYTYLVSNKKDNDNIMSFNFGVYRKPHIGANRKLEKTYELCIKSKNLEVEVNGH